MSRAKRKKKTVWQPVSDGGETQKSLNGLSVNTNKEI